MLYSLYSEYTGDGRRYLHRCRRISCQPPWEWKDEGCMQVFNNWDKITSNWMEITVTSHNNIITSYRCMEDNGPGPLGFSPVVELTKMWLFVCPFLSLALSLFSPLPFLSSLFHPKNYRCCCPSPNLHIFIIFFFLFLFSLSASSFFFFFFFCPPFFF